jgi:hypothetical protein
MALVVFEVAVESEHFEDLVFLKMMLSEQARSRVSLAA